MQSKAQNVCVWKYSYTRKELRQGWDVCAFQKYKTWFSACVLPYKHAMKRRVSWWTIGGNRSKLSMYTMLFTIHWRLNALGVVLSLQIDPERTQRGHIAPVRRLQKCLEARLTLVSAHGLIRWNTSGPCGTHDKEILSQLIRDGMGCIRLNSWLAKMPSAVGCCAQ